MSLLNHFEVGSACKEFERKKWFFECSVFFCKHCSSSISHNNKSFSNLTTHRIQEKNPHKMSSQEKTPQEKTPQKSPVEKTPHPILGLVEKTPRYFQACGENPSTL